MDTGWPLPRILTSAVLILTLVWNGSCGARGAPVPPKALFPVAPSRVEAEVTPEGVRVSCRVPTQNSDGSPLEDLDRLELWRADPTAEDCPKCPPMFRMLAVIPCTRPEAGGKPAGTVQYLDETVVPGDYIYRLLAVTARGVRGKTSDEIKVYWEIPPGIVEGLRVQAGDRRVELIWNAVTLKTDGTPLEAVTYEVFRGMKDTGFGKRPLNPSPLSEPRFIDTDVQNNIDYQYRVRAVRSVGDQFVVGPFSETVEATAQDRTPPDRPKKLVALPMEKGIRLIWEGVEQADISGYRVYRAQTSQGPWMLLTDQPLSTILFDDQNVQRGQYYWYAVTAMDDATPPNESPMSDPVQARIP